MLSYSLSFSVGYRLESQVSDVLYPDSLGHCPQGSTLNGYDECVTHHSSLYRFFEFVSPFHQWHNSPVAGIVVGILDLLFLALLVVLIKFAIERIYWYRNRKRCQHDYCGHVWTLGLSDGSHTGCVSEQACCGVCRVHHVAMEEQRRMCPDDGAVMDKIIKHSVIYDCCPNANSSFWSVANSRNWNSSRMTRATAPVAAPHRRPA